MKIIKLGPEHSDKIKPLFKIKKFMGVDPADNYFVGTVEFTFDEMYHRAFIETYLSNLNNYHAYGAKDKRGKIVGIISFYESTDDASWYGTGIRNSGHPFTNRDLLDAAIKHNEENGRYKFYTLWSTKHATALRRLMFSKDANERYDYFDEFYVDAKHQCKFNMPWQVLYNRTLLPAETVMRCTFLKQEYRTEIFNAGRL